MSFFQIDRKIELCRNYIKVLDNFTDNWIFDDLFRFSQCWNQASDSGEEGESIDEVIDSVTDMKNIAKGTTDPRVEFISQDHSSQIINILQFQNLD